MSVNMADPENGTNATESSEEENETAERREIVDKLMRDPQMLAVLQTKLKKYLGTPSGYVESLPNVVKRRIKALKNLQLKFTDIEAEFFKEVHGLEEKYDKLNGELYKKRSEILNGIYEPTDKEAEFDLYSDEELDIDTNTLCKTLQEKAKVDEEMERSIDEEMEKTTGEEKEKTTGEAKEKTTGEAKEKTTGEEKEKAHGFDENTKGIPEFWLTIFKNVDLLTEMIQDHDEPILTHLQDIKLKLNDDPMGFTLDFLFSDNDYFTNKSLTKYYEMTCDPDTEDPFSFEGPEIIKCEGCKINWKKGKNVTQKTIKKKQKHKSRGAFRTVTTTVQNDSFFNFFNPPPIPELTDDMDEDTQALLTADFEIGHYIRERIIPRAVLYFTGEALDDKDYEEEEDEAEEEYDSEDDSDYEPAKGNSVEQKEPDCKNQ